jgi:hypothetical protein
MTDVRKLIPKVESVIKTADPDAIVGRTFYDDMSGRLFVTIFKGSRKADIVLLGRDMVNGNDQRIKQAVDAGVNRLQHSPIG